MPGVRTGAIALSASHNKAVKMMVVSSVVISFSGLLVRFMDASPLTLNFHRAIGLMLSVSILLFIQYRRSAIDQVIGIGLWGVLAGVMLAGAGISFLQSLAHTTVANTLFVLSAIPFFTAALAWLLLREKLRRTTMVTMMIAMLGLAIMVWEGFGAGSLVGNLLAIATALFFAVYAVIIRMKREINMLPTLLVSTVMIMLIASISLKGNLSISVKDFLLCMFWGGVMSGLANWLFIAASRYLAAGELTLFMLLEFALGPVWVWLVLSETPSKWTLAGGVLVIGAVAAKALIDARTLKKQVLVS